MSFYNETRHREVVTIDEYLRHQTYKLIDAMHKTFESGFTPKIDSRNMI